MRRRLDPPGLTNVWPAFTDALGGLVVVLVFFATIFVIAEVLLGREMANQSTAIGQLSNVTDYLENLLGEANTRAERLERRVARLEGEVTSREELLEAVHAELAAAEAARARLRTSLGESRARAGALEQVIAQRDAALAALRDSRQALGEELQAREQAYAGLQAAKAESDQALTTLETQAALISARAERLAAEVERLNDALLGTRGELAEARTELGERERALARQEQTLATQQDRLEQMDQLIKRRLVDRVEELEAYASDFFGRLRKVFADNPDIKIVGDRFVFQSEVLFPSGEARLSPAGEEDLDKFVAVFEQLAGQLPEDLPVLIEVQGHTDRVPISTAEFASNWELSAARALSVVRYLIRRGIPPRRLAATGMGEYHPVDPRDTPEAYRRNRRIELKITSR